MKHGQQHHNHRAPGHCCSTLGSQVPSPERLAKDPVCGMNVDPTAPKGGSSNFNGETYYFCNPKCKTKFDAEPEKYLKKDVTPVTATDMEKIYTCPMHPEVRQKGPGNCPICGMALEPEEVSLEEETNPELVDLRDA